MHSLLEEYLKHVASHLWGLPRKHRADEMHELRQHLETQVAASQEQGKTETEAIQATLRQFGRPEKLGRQVAGTWWRGRLLSWRDSAISTAVAAGLLFYLPSIIVNLLFPMRTIALGGVLSHGIPLPLEIVWYVLIGGFVGWKLSKRARVATLIAVLSAVVLGNVLRPFLMWPVDQGARLPELSFSGLSTRGVNAWDPLLLWSALFITLFATPAALAGRTLAKRRMVR